LSQFKECVGSINHSATMKISDLICPSCHAFYEVAESTSAKGIPGRVQCAVCGELSASWQEPRLMACRLVLPPKHKYPIVSPPSSPTA
jgi:hypothetical protein